VRTRSPILIVFGVVAFLMLVMVFIAETSGSDAPTVVENTETSAAGQTPVRSKPVPLDALETDMGVDRVVNARLGVVLSRDSGATCERVSRTRFACSVLRGVEDIVTGWWVRCPPPRSLDDWAAWCSLSQRMTPEERCQFGVRSGDPFTAADVWKQEAVICRKLGVPID
jgi:hypothetical protein